MPPKLKNPEQLEIDGDILSEFKAVCNTLEKNWRWKLRSLIQDFNAENRKKVFEAVNANAPINVAGNSTYNGNEMLDRILGYMDPDKFFFVGSTIHSLRTDYSLDENQRKTMKKFLASLGIGIGRFGQVYITIKDKNLAALSGSVNYARYIRRECPEYRETKTCSVAGVSRRCLVMDFGEAEG